MQKTILTDDQYHDLTRKIIGSLSERHRIAPLNSLKHPKYRLKVPVHITLEFEENKTIASLGDVEAFAHADTEFEAMDRLCEEIVQLYEDLREDRENLGPLPAKWLQFLEEVILPR